MNPHDANHTMGRSEKIAFERAQQRQRNAVQKLAPTDNPKFYVEVLDEAISELIIYRTEHCPRNRKQAMELLYNMALLRGIIKQAAG